MAVRRALLAVLSTAQRARHTVRRALRTVRRVLRTALLAAPSTAQRARHTVRRVLHTVRRAHLEGTVQQALRTAQPTLPRLVVRLLLELRLARAQLLRLARTRQLHSSRLLLLLGRLLSR